MEVMSSPFQNHHFPATDQSVQYLRQAAQAFVDLEEAKKKILDLETKNKEQVNAILERDQKIEPLEHRARIEELDLETANEKITNLKIRLKNAEQELKKKRYVLSENNRTIRNLQEWDETNKSTIQEIKKREETRYRKVDDLEKDVRNARDENRKLINVMAHNTEEMRSLKAKTETQLWKAKQEMDRVVEYNNRMRTGGDKMYNALLARSEKESVALVEAKKERAVLETKITASNSARYALGAEVREAKQALADKDKELEDMKQQLRNVTERK